MGKYILVTGGELFNKGAQAMTFITVSEMAKRYPDKKVVLMSARDYQRSRDEKKKYCFEFISYPNLKTQLLSPILKNIKYKKGNTINREFLKILKETDAIIDISGYALGSNWGSDKAISYMMKIIVGYFNRIPVYLMPQSFGPFEFDGKKGKIANVLIKIFLPKAKCVMARENVAKELIDKKYPKTHTIKTYDLVLQNKEINIETVFRKKISLINLEISKGSVALIPNSKAITYSSEEKAYFEYKCFVDSILKNQKKVYLIYHAVEDYTICKRLKIMYYKSNSNVVVVNEELNCLDFDKNVKKFDFIVGSRFHSIVHAYKNSIPAIVLGWAVKYRELMEIFGQERYQFDSKNINSEMDIQKAVDTMCENYIQESIKIKTKLQIVQKDNVFDKVKI